MELIELRLKDDTFSRNTPLEDELERRELVERVYRTLLDMKPIHREILLYRHCIGMFYDDVYKMMGGKRKEFATLHKEAHREFRDIFMTNYPEYCIGW